MILFLGCSFTWGAGLQFEYLIDNEGWSTDDCEKLIPPNSFLEHLNYKSDMFRKEKHFPNLVAKHFDKHYSLGKFGNGGDNGNATFVLKNLGDFLVHQLKDRVNPIKLIVIQFTDWTRKPMWTLEQQVDKTIEAIGDINWIGISWQDDISEYLKKVRPYNFCPIEFDGATYDSFEHIINQPPEETQDWRVKHKLTLFGKYNGKLHDDHFSSKGHEVMAKSIIKKIEENNIF